MATNNETRPAALIGDGRISAEELVETIREDRDVIKGGPILYVHRADTTLFAVIETGYLADLLQVNEFLAQPWVIERLMTDAPRAQVVVPSVAEQKTAMPEAPKHGGHQSDNPEGSKRNAHAPRVPIRRRVPGFSNDW